MNCKNCGARIKENSKVCPNCGAFIDDGFGYVLLTDNYKTADIYPETVEQRKKGGVIKYLISLLLVVAIVAGGAYYYFTNIYIGDQSPELSFTTGSGLINDDQQIIYVALPENSRIEYIHGVQLYDYDKNNATLKQDPISSKYEYTKGIDDSFRAIFFDVGDIPLEAGTQYVYTFEMNFSFIDSSEIYTYEQTVSFDGDINEDVAEIIFDHSLISEISTTQADSAVDETTTVKATAPAESTTKETTTEETTVAGVSYIYNSFWFTQPYNDNDTNYSISALKFNSNGTYVETVYAKNGTGKWTTTKLNGKYEIKDGQIFTTDSEGQIQSYALDSNASTLDGLTSRKYNSVKNAEDFFGM